MEIIQRASTTPFLLKLWQMLSDAANVPIIAWDESGRNFEVKQPDEMAKVLLPKHFRHNNYSSFQRQLNYFGFRKVGRGEHGCLYMHELFNKNRPEDVPKIRRKTNPGKAWSANMTNKSSDKAAALMMNQLKVSNGCPSPRNGYVENGPKSKRRKFHGANGLLIPGLTHIHTIMPSGSQSPKEEAAEALTQLTSPRPSPMEQDQLPGTALKRSASAPHLNGLLSNSSLQLANAAFETYKDATNTRLSALETEVKSMKEMLKTIAAAVGAASPAVNQKQEQKQPIQADEEVMADAVVKNECKEAAQPTPRPTLVSS